MPSGYFSDTVGRRRTLLIAAGALIAAYGLFFFGSSFAAFAAAQLAFAVAQAVNSGTDTSFHYDSLRDLGRGSEFGPREGRVTRVAFLSGAAAALLGGVAASFSLRLTYGLSLAAAVATFAIVWTFAEPGFAEPGHRRGESGAPSFARQLRSCLGDLRRPHLAWLFAFGVLMNRHQPHPLRALPALPGPAAPIAGYHPPSPRPLWSLAFTPP